MIKWERRVSGVYKRTPGNNTYACTIKKRKDTKYTYFNTWRT